MEPEDWQIIPEDWERAADIPMEPEIWQALPLDLLLMIISRLPMRVLAKMRTVSTGWNVALSLPDAPRTLDGNFSVHSIPGFLVQLHYFGDSSNMNIYKHIVETWIIEYLGGDSSDMTIYKVPLPNDIVIVNACNSICCFYRGEDALDLSISNIATRSGRRLPRPQHLQRWEFIAMDFDPSRRCCTVLLGQSNNTYLLENNNGRRRLVPQNKMVMDIYDSESNEWTRISMTIPRFITPRGKGIYSNGKVYLIADLSDGHSLVIEISIADETWALIEFPDFLEHVYCPKQHELGGCNGRVALMVFCNQHGRSHMWKLKEGPGAPQWCEPNSIWTPQHPRFNTVEANSSGWTMMFDQDLKISLCNPKRRLQRSITLPLLNALPEPSGIFVSAFESNNVSWP